MHGHRRCLFREMRDRAAQEGRAMLSPAERSLRGRIGAYRLHAMHDPRETTAAGRAAFLAGFEREVDPDGVLPPAERARRAAAARKAHFARLALASARARRERAGAAGGQAVRR
jgi:hypothetical protein